jgi:hypothetical protein
LISIVVATAAVCVCTMSLPPRTSTVSSRPPTSSRGRIDAGTAALMTTFGTTVVLNPMSETVTV